MTTTIGRGHTGLALLPRSGRLLAVDPGRVRVGLARTDDAQRVASALPTQPAGRDHQDTASAIAELPEVTDVVGVVVGWPRGLDGSDGEAGRDAAALATAIHQTTGHPTTLWDERFTTVEAERVMIAADTSRARRRQQIDGVAATLILQTVLDARRLSN